MRLGQLSRKLKVKPQEIVTFIAENFSSTVEVHPNSKIEDDFIAKIEEHFKLTENPEKEGEKDSIEEATLASADHVEQTESKDERQIESEEIVEDTIVEEELEVPADNNTSESTDKAESAKENTDKDISQNEGIQEEDLNLVDGVVKAPKVEVEGIKVVGKIDLPEKKEPAAEVEEGESPEQPENSKETVKPNKKRRERKKRSKRKKPEISLEEQKRRELEAYEKEKAAIKEAEKRKKKKHYEQKVAKQKTSVTKQKKKTKSTQKKETTSDSAPATLWGKFIKWLNT
jgi:hypothetical protein